MDFSKISQFSDPGNDSLEQFEITTLNQAAQDELFSLLDDKKFDCRTKEAKKQISENLVFISFIRKTLQPLDPSSKHLTTTILKLLIQDFMDSSYKSPKDLSKVLPKLQLTFITLKSNMPKNMQDELNNTITYYLEQYPDSYPFTKLIGFIKSKHPTIHNFLSTERIRDYISLSFIVVNLLENFSFASYELSKKIESQKTVSEIFHEICKTLEHKIKSVEFKLEKFSLVGEFYDNFLVACSEVKKKEKRGVADKLLVLVNKNLLGQILPEIGKARSRGETEVAELRSEDEVKSKILREQVKMLSYLTEKSLKYLNYQQEIQSVSESELVSKQSSVKSQLFSLLTRPSSASYLPDSLSSISRSREKLLSSIEIKTEELFYLNSIQDQKIQKTKALFRSPKSISILLYNEFLHTEEDLYRRTRDLSLQLKLVESENKKVLDRKYTIKQSQNNSFSFVHYLEILLLSLMFFLLGIIAQSLLGYFKVFELLI